MKLTEAIKLLSRLPKNPFGVYDELKVRRELRREHSTIPSPSYQPRDFQTVVSEIQECLQIDLNIILTEPALAEIEEKVQLNIQNLSKYKLPFPLIHNGDPNLGRLCYAICRALKPLVFVETGVAYGVTSSFILQALKVNNKGKLFSIDRAPVKRRAAEFVGKLIPDELRNNWQLCRGESQKLLPGLLKKLEEIDIFLHDSRHTYTNMSSEFKIVAPYLKNRSVLLADDVNRNIAFEEWVSSTNPEVWSTIPEISKESLFGVSIFLDKPKFEER